LDSELRKEAAKKKKKEGEEVARKKREQEAEQMKKVLLIMEDIKNYQEKMIQIKKKCDVGDLWEKD